MVVVQDLLAENMTSLLVPDLMLYTIGVLQYVNDAVSSAAKVRALPVLPHPLDRSPFKNAADLYPVWWVVL